VDGDLGNDLVSGGAGADVLYGDQGKDTINGGAGSDRAFGGAGADRFVFRSTADTTAINEGADYIADFSFAQGDRVDLRSIDANQGQAGNQAFKFVGTANFTAAGQVRYSVSEGDAFIALNTDADADAEAVIHIEQLGVKAGWFLL
jgi:Ca2+-binding RTX toxin-like protein